MRAEPKFTSTTHTTKNSSRISTPAARPAFDPFACAPARIIHQSMSMTAVPGRNSMNAPPHSSLQVRYRWTLDANGQPLSIAVARNGGAYTCPLCNGQMTARLGLQVAHHFSHEKFSPRCTAEAVNHALLRRWMALHLRSLMAAQATVTVRWNCSICGQQHSADMLKGITAVEEVAAEGKQTADPASILLPIVLLAGTAPHALIFLRPGDHETNDDTRTALDKRLSSAAEAGLGVYTLPDDATPTNDDSAVETLLTPASDDVLCPNLNAIPQMVRGLKPIQKLLLDTVSKFPEYAYVEIKTINGLHDMARWGDKVLWLPPDRWAAHIGGSLNRLAPDVHILSQTWPHPAGGFAVVHYAVARNTAAIGIRRYPDGTQPNYAINDDVYAARTKAVDMIRALVKFQVI